MVTRSNSQEWAHDGQLLSLHCLPVLIQLVYHHLPPLICQHAHHQTKHPHHTSVNMHIIRLPTPIAHVSTCTLSHYQLLSLMCQHTHYQTTNSHHTPVNRHIIRLPTPTTHLSTYTSSDYPITSLICQHIIRLPTPTVHPSPCTLSDYQLLSLMCQYTHYQTTNSHHTSVNIHIVRLNTPTTHLSTDTSSDYQLPSLICQHTHHQTTQSHRSSVNIHIIRLPTHIAHLSTHHQTTNSHHSSVNIHIIRLPTHIAHLSTHHQTTNSHRSSVNIHIIRLPPPTAHLSTHIIRLPTPTTHLSTYTSDYQLPPHICQHTYHQTIKHWLKHWFNVEASGLFAWCWQRWCGSNLPGVWAMPTASNWPFCMMLTTLVWKQLTIFLHDADNFGVDATDLFVWYWQLGCRSNLPYCVSDAEVSKRWAVWVVQKQLTVLHYADNFGAEATDLFVWCWQLGCGSNLPYCANDAENVCGSNWPFCVMLTTLVQKQLTFVCDADIFGAEVTDLFMRCWQLGCRSYWPFCVMLTTFVW